MNGDIGVRQRFSNVMLNFVAELVSLFNGHIVPDNDMEVNVSVLACLSRPEAVSVNELVGMRVKDLVYQRFLFLRQSSVKQVSDRFPKDVKSSLDD
jgi:hypothetical protein